MKGKYGGARKQRKEGRVGRSKGSMRWWAIPPFLELPMEGIQAHRNGSGRGSAGGLMIYLDPGHLCQSTTDVIALPNPLILDSYEKETNRWQTETNAARNFTCHINDLQT